MTDDLFVTGTDTNVGKTVSFRAAGGRARRHSTGSRSKPAQRRNRPRTVMRWAEIPEEQTLPECYCFDPPVSPHLAAETERRRIELGEIQRPGLASGKIADRRGRRRNPGADQRFRVHAGPYSGILDMPVIVPRARRWARSITLA